MRAGTDHNSKIIAKRTSGRSYGRQRSSITRIDLAELGLSPRGLLAAALRARPENSARTHLSRVIKVVEALLAHPRHRRHARAVLSTPASKLNPREIWELFAAAEDTVSENHAWSEKYTPSFLFRQLISDLPDRLIDGSVIRQSVIYKTRFSERTAGPRGILSDHWDPHSPDSRFAPPASQLEHSSLDELHAKVLAHLEYRQQRIAQAAWSVLDDFIDFRTALFDRIRSNPLPPEILLKIENDLPFKKKDLGRSRTVTTLPTADMLLAFCQISEKLGLFRRDTYLQWSASHMFWSSNQVRKETPEVSRFATNAHGIRSIVVANHYLPPYVVFACWVYVIARTGWNPQTVLAMRPTSIIPQPDETIDLVSLKERSDQFQHFVVKKSDEPMRIMLEELKSHQFNLALYWNLDVDGSLFTSQTFRPKLQPVLPGRLLKKFQREFKLPRFKLTELRGQEFSQLYVKTGDPEVVRIAAGHENLEQTAHYLSVSVLSVLRAANINEFERRLGATAVFDIRGKDEAITRGYKEKHVDNRLFKPTGIGTGCNDASNGPPEFRLANGECRGYPCENCPQHSVVITRDRIREAQIALHFYEKHGADLVARTPGAIDTDLVSQICFNIALCNFVKKSTFGTIYVEIEKELARDWSRVFASEQT